jgi:hypothetical protein
MAANSFSADESRKLAVLIARVWGDAKLEQEYMRDPETVLQGAGITLAGRRVPEIPEKPAELAAQSLVAAASGSSASSISCATCPCSGCTASCACCNVKPEQFREHIDTIMKLADSPERREQARKMMNSWDIKVRVQTQPEIV